MTTERIDAMEQTVMQTLIDTEKIAVEVAAAKERLETRA